MTAESDKVMLVVSFLKDDALIWFEPVIRDYIKYDEDEWNDYTAKLYNDYNEFKKAFKGTFGDLDEERVAEKEL